MQNLFKETLKFLSICDGAHQTAKGLHWGAEHHSTHILTDDIDSAVLEYQDKIAEIVMGLVGEKFQVGQLKSLVGNAKDCRSFLVELEGDVINYKKSLGDDVRMDAIKNVLDDFLSDINKWKYLEKLT